MTEPTITCPHCHSEIRLTESLAAPLLAATRQQYEEKISQKNAEIAAREDATRAKERALREQQSTLNDQVASQVEEQLKQDRLKIKADAEKKASLAMHSEMQHKAAELEELKEIIKSNDQKLAEAQKAQADIIKKQRALDDEKRELELTVEKRVQVELNQTREKARKDVEAEQKLKVMEKEHTIQAMQKQIEELKRRAEQGSQQLQGEVQELELEQLLINRFPIDLIEPVPKGEFGGDVLQRVRGSGEQPSGTILWEFKRTKNWNDAWLAKLRADQRDAKAEISVIVSHALPKDVETFDLIDGVWVAHPRVVLPVALMLRQSLQELALVRQANEGQQTKTEMVYQYLTGAKFRLRIEAIVEAFSTLQTDLDKERKVIMKQWAKREQQIEKVMASTVGMYGDLQGIAGQSLQEIEGLELDSVSLLNMD